MLYSDFRLIASGCNDYFFFFLLTVRPFPYLGSGSLY